MSEDEFWVGVHGVVATNGRLLVLRRAPEMRYQPGTWDLPGGHLCIGEDFEACLVREITEETGLEVEIERLLGVQRSPGPYIQALFACRPVHADAEVLVRPFEHVAARWVTPAELKTLELIPYLRGALERGTLGYLDGSAPKPSRP